MSHPHPQDGDAHRYQQEREQGGDGDERQARSRPKIHHHHQSGQNKAPPNSSAKRRAVPLSCEKEPIHVINRIQPCGCLLVVDSDLTLVQCSVNAVDLLPPDDDDGNGDGEDVEVTDDAGKGDGDGDPPGGSSASGVATSSDQQSPPSKRAKVNEDADGDRNAAAGADDLGPPDHGGGGGGGGAPLLQPVIRSDGTVGIAPDAPGAAHAVRPGSPLERRLRGRIIGRPLSDLLPPDAVAQVRAVVDTSTAPSHLGVAGASSVAAAAAATVAGTGAAFHGGGEASRNFVVRSRGMFLRGQASCSVIQSGEHFLLEMENAGADKAGMSLIGEASHDGCGGVGGAVGKSTRDGFVVAEAAMKVATSAARTEEKMERSRLGAADERRSRAAHHGGGKGPDASVASTNADGTGGTEGAGGEPTPAVPVPVPVASDYQERDVMVFMEDIARELRKCWSIEEMASLVCSRIMAETPYDRGMVYRFDHDDSGEVIYERFRPDARHACRKDSFLGLRFPASDIPRQARELFMRNTLRFVYNVNGRDWALYPTKVQSSMGSKYTDLSMCRLRGSSYVHLRYLQNMGVTSSMVIAIIVNRRLWGLYSFHGYREPLVPSARTRFLCEMASIMTSMIMESLTRMADHNRLMEIDRLMLNLHKTSIIDFMEKHHSTIKDLLCVNQIAYRIHDDPSSSSSRTYGPEERGAEEDGQLQLSTEAFDSLCDTYGTVSRDYGVVFIDEQKSHPTLAANGLHTLAFFHVPGLDIVLSRQPTVETVDWGGDPDKKLETDGTLSPRNSFATYVKDHLKRGKPWDEVDRQIVNRFIDQIEKYRSQEMFKEREVQIQTLTEEKKVAIDQAKLNFDFFAHMAHELRTPFHGLLGSLEAMLEEPNLRNNELLKTAEVCGKSMLKILDDILLVAKGSYSLEIEEQNTDIEDFLKQTLGDMLSYARMEGVSIRIQKEDYIHKDLLGDFNRVRQVINNLISNAIKFSNDDIYIEVQQRKTFREVLTVWKTYQINYKSCEPALADLQEYAIQATAGDDVLWTIFSVIDKGIGIAAVDLKRLGNAFTQLSSGIQKKYQGTGLGITICNMLINALKGRLLVFSVPGFGSCFTFAIPVKMADKPKKTEKPSNQEEEEKKAKIQKLQKDFEENGLNNANYKILVVDDVAINRKLCSRKVKRVLPLITITECACGKTTLDEYEYDHKNILGIFMDYHMHDMDGDECTRKIREYEQMNEGVESVYIVGYTADVLEESAEMLLKAGMNSVIPKPEPVLAFENALQNMMENYLKCADKT